MARDDLLAQQDTRHNYGELRMIGYASIGAWVFCVVLTNRGIERRTVSLEKANA